MMSTVPSHSSGEQFVQTTTEMSSFGFGSLPMKEIVDVSSRICLTLPKKKKRKSHMPRFLSPARKNAVEVELAKCKIDMMSLNSQLLDAIQQKVNLSQQLEAWQVSSAPSQQCLGATWPGRHPWVTLSCSPWLCCVLSPGSHRQERLLLALQEPVVQRCSGG